MESIEDAKEQIAVECGRPATVWATSARVGTGSLAYADARCQLATSARPFLLLLGTGWGLTSSVLSGSDAVIEPIRGADGYNHLSVRCAAAIMVDRLLSRSLE